jgi:hypothetical protein
MNSHDQHVRARIRRRVVAIVAVVGSAAAVTGCTALRAALAGGTGNGSELELRNDLAQAVNVYVRRVNASGEVFLRLVDAGAVDTVRLRGIPRGQTIRLRATTVSGDRTVEQDTLVVERTSSWHLRAQ